MCGMVGTFTIVVLGSPGVGKTAIIRQFLYNDFSQVYTPTTSKYVHRPSVILDDTMYDLKIVDVPHIPAFPTTGAQEWSDSRCRGIRNANAYVLVYDICCFDSFEYVKTIRQQIAEVRFIFLCRCLEGACNILPVTVWVSFRCSSFLPQSKDLSAGQMTDPWNLRALGQTSRVCRSM
ncbi:ras-like protein family member 10A isoform X4 [Hypanus sabinus]|uniref:ras-like protein family member 10A isoform X4 n=1 Tax=Hypanus sabinus TaxID=79690 RepID=UPI0028C42C21|nr:ras-like protein family member 10A isoform X4 [Hypanus sabinus]